MSPASSRSSSAATPTRSWPRSPPSCPASRPPGDEDVECTGEARPRPAAGYPRRMTETKITLPESAIPERWYNIAADMPNRPQPVLHPGTGEPVGPDDLAPLFPHGPHPPGGLDGRGDRRSRTRSATSTASGARRRSTARTGSRQALGTRSRIFYKYEGTSPAGSHKPNTAVAQAYYVKESGRTRIATETGAGQWGSAVALAVAALRARVQGLHGQGLVRAEAVPPLDDGDLGRERRRQPVARTRTPGARSSQPTRPRPAASASPSRRRSRTRRSARTRAYSLGSVLNHVLMHQTVIGQEALAQMELAGAFPGPRRRLRRRRLQLRRARLPVPAREDRRPGDRGARLRAGRLPDADARPLRLRLRGHEPADAARPHAHARPRLRPAGHPRGGPPLPRDGAARLAARPRRARPRRGLRPDRRLRLGGAVRAHRGDHPGARVGARDPRRRPGGGAGGRGGPRAHDPLQPLRPRPLRPGRLRRLPPRPARGLRASRRTRSPGRSRRSSRCPKPAGVT